MFCEKPQCCYSILAMFIQCFCIVHLQCQFGEPLCLFFFLTVRSYSCKRRCSYSSYIFFPSLPFVLFFFFYIYCYTDTISFIIISQLLKCQFLINQNKNKIWNCDQPQLKINVLWKCSDTCFYIYYYTDTTNFTIFSQLLRCQFLISQNKIIKYKTVINHNWK